MNLNVVNLVGRVGQDPDVKYFESGKVKATFSLAVDRGKGKNPDWFSIEAWGKTAEVVAQYVTKGKQLAIEGSLKIDFWQDRTTKADRSAPKIACNRLTMLGSKRDEEVQSSGKSKMHESVHQDAAEFDEIEEDEFPI